MPETDTNTAVPAYLNETTGAITDGDAWVSICSAKITNDSGLTDVTFESTTGKNNWSQYQDLCLLGHLRVTDGGAQYHLNFNDSTSGYILQLMDQGATSGSGVTVRSYAEYGGGRGEATVRLANNATPAYTFTPAMTWFADINSAKQKVFWTQAGWAGYTPDGMVSIVNNRWESQDPITKIKIWTSGTAIADHSRFELYGILSRIVAP